jgi:uncharacterized membrane protein
MEISKRQTVHWLFNAAVAIKACDGVLEVFAGAFLAIKPGWVGPAAEALAETLLTRHPANWMMEAVARWGEGLTIDTEHFASSYLIAHGLAKIFVAWGLFREKLWAFPSALGVFGLLILFQLYRFTHTHSLTLAGLITLDVAVCYLIWREYGFRRVVIATATV